MILFLDRLPLYTWLPAGAELPLWSVCVPLLLTDPEQLVPPQHARPQRWAIDTRFTGEAFAWRHHLQEAGLNPDTHRCGHTSLTPLGGTPQLFPLRDVNLWLVSNLPALRATPWRLELDQGVAFRDVPHLPNPEGNCPLLGLRALLDAGLRVHLDFGRATVSVWVPGPWYRQLAVSVRHCLNGFRTLPAPW